MKWLSSIGAGAIGQAIARRISAGKHVLLADLRQENADAASEVLSDAGFENSTTTVDVSERDSVLALVEKATSLGEVTGLIHAAGVSPSQASPDAILRVDQYGTALVLEEFGGIIGAGGSGVVIASQSGHRLHALTAEQDKTLATTPVEELLALPMLQPDHVTDPLDAYQLSKRGNVLRVMAEAVRWGKHGARINAISPGIIVTPLARDELTGPRGEGYRSMISGSPAGRAGTPDEVATVGALLMGPDGAFITGSDILIGRRGHRVLLLRRARPEVSGQHATCLALGRSPSTAQASEVMLKHLTRRAAPSGWSRFWPTETITSSATGWLPGRLRGSTVPRHPLPRSSTAARNWLRPRTAERRRQRVRTLG